MINLMANYSCKKFFSIKFNIIHIFIFSFYNYTLWSHNCSCIAIN